MSKIAQKLIVAHVRTCTQILASLLFSFFPFLPKNDSDIQYAMVQRVHGPGVGGGGRMGIPVLTVHLLDAKDKIPVLRQ